MGNEISEKVPFFPEFRKIETIGLKMPVIDVTMGAHSVHILAMV